MMKNTEEIVNKYGVKDYPLFMGLSQTDKEALSTMNFLLRNKGVYQFQIKKNEELIHSFINSNTMSREVHSKMDSICNKITGGSSPVETIILSVFVYNITLIHKNLQKTIKDGGHKYSDIKVSGLSSALIFSNEKPESRFDGKLISGNIIVEYKDWGYDCNDVSIPLYKMRFDDYFTNLLWYK